MSTIIGYKYGPRGESEPIVEYDDPLIPPLPASGH